MRGAVAAGAAVVLALGLGLVVWAVTPASGSAWSVMRGAIGALGAADFIHPSIGGIVVTLTPLLLTFGCLTLIASAALRPDPRIGAADAVIGGLVAGLVFSAVIVGVVSAVVPVGLRDPSHAWAPILFGAVVGLLAPLVRADACAALRERIPVASSAGVRGAAGILAALLVAGTLAVAVGLLLDLPTAIELSRQIAPSIGGGLGMLVLGIVLLPNAAIAGAGYVAVVGFSLADGTYSPLGATKAELPAMPLMAAVPGVGRVDAAALCWVLIPLFAAAWAGWGIRRRIVRFTDRAMAVLVTAVAAALGAAVLAAVSRGGLVGASSLLLSVPVGIFAAAVGVGALLVTAATVLTPDPRAATARSRTSPPSSAADAADREPESNSDREPELQSDSESEEQPEFELPDAEQQDAGQSSDGDSDDEQPGGEQGSAGQPAAAPADDQHQSVDAAVAPPEKILGIPASPSPRAR